MSRTKFIPYSRQSISSADITSVSKALRACLITQGPLVKQFEEAFAKYCDAPYAVAVSSGTAALHLATLAAGFDARAEVITSPLSFVATANSILYAKAKPRFVDIDSKTLGLDPTKVIADMNSKTRGIMPVHYSGQPCDIQAYQKLRKSKLMIIEDACHALGAESMLGSKMKRIGHCLNSDMAVFSFHAVKHITTGEGGMITTRSKKLYDKLCLLRSHGITKDAKRFNRKSGLNEPWYYEMQDLGFNYRMSDFQCALGLAQLKKLDAFISRRREIARIYDKQLRSIQGIQLPEHVNNTSSSYHLYVLRINYDYLKKSRSKVMADLVKRGIGTQVHYIPITQQPYYQSIPGVKKVKHPICDSFYQQALSIPMHPTMSASDIKRVISGIKDVCKS